MATAGRGEAMLEDTFEEGKLTFSKMQLPASQLKKDLSKHELTVATALCCQRIASTVTKQMPVQQMLSRTKQAALRYQKPCTLHAAVGQHWPYHEGKGLKTVTLLPASKHLPLSCGRQGFLR